LDGKVWPTTEHYFQAQKFLDPKLQKMIRKLQTPRECHEFVRQPHIQRQIRSDWFMIREEVMYRAVKAKFTQHLHLKQMLLDTGDAILVEHTDNDNFWGDGGDGRGQNKLGHILMRVRDEIRNRNQDIKQHTNSFQQRTQFSNY
jgi:hypothetical protein